MENDEHDMIPESENLPETADPEVGVNTGDDARFAPPIDAQIDAVEMVGVEDEHGDTYSDSTFNPDAAVTDGMDIEAALAAVSTLSDMVAEQEAAEQARIAQEEAEAQAAAERQARMEHPERFFPVPPMSSLHRGQMASVIPALVLIVVGAWLTFTLTTKAPPDAALLAVVVTGGIGLTLLVRWLSSGRWARGSLFFGLTALFTAGSIFYLLQPSSPGLTGGWPILLIALGAGILLTGILAVPRDNHLLLPSLIMVTAGAAGLVISLGVLGRELVTTAGSMWPVAVAIVVIIWALPLIFRQRG